MKKSGGCGKLAVMTGLKKTGLLVASYLLFHVKKIR